MSPSIRKSVPAGWQRAGRRAYVGLGQRTPGERVLPDFVLIGGQRCGTTSLFRALMQHPHVVRPTFHKGVNYFDVNYFRGPAWYAGHFPLRALAQHRSGSGSPRVFEASGYYMFHPEAIQRLRADLPDTKLVVMLRDPVERAYSAWKHESSRGFEWESFERALALEDKRLVGEVDRMKADSTYQSFCHRHHSYRGRGEYADLLDAALASFPREQLHVMYSEDFFDRPEPTFASLCSFLRLEGKPPIAFDRFNARPRQPMLQDTRERLTRHFASQVSRLQEIAGSTPPWPI